MTTETTDSATTPMTDAEREEAASQLVDRFSLWSGAAGLIPVPLIDVVAVGGVQLQMLRKLSEIYGVPFTDNRGKSVIASLRRRHHSGQHRDHDGDDLRQPDQGNSRHRLGGRRFDHAGVLRRRHLRDRPGVHEALRLRRHAS